MGDDVEEQVAADLPYLDGAEAYLAEVFERVTDRSSGSDELQDAIVDWPTQYHLSCLRANLLRPLVLDATTSVLDVGAGTGALARYLGEVCGRVVALEGSKARAVVASRRCTDLGNVEVRHGTLADLSADERFDVVLLCGVLEYSGAAIGGGLGPDEMLARAVAHLADGGMVALAIENQLGLKYLLGAPEDHRGAPWVGLDDYPGPPGVRTWSRRELLGLLDRAGLTDHRLLLPFPDYKLPTLVLDEALYDEPDAPELVDQLLPRPVRVADGEPARLADAAAAHGVFVRAGLGADVASSFLVLAGTSPAAIERRLPRDVLAWLYGPLRRSRWRRARRLTRDRVLEHLEPPDRRHEGWLVQDPGATRPFHVGRTFGQEARAAIRGGDLDALGAVLRRWSDELDHRQDAPVAASASAGPFGPLGLHDGVLPSELLDASLDNFVVLGDGSVRFVDDEWRSVGPLSSSLARVRALWILARDVVESGIDHPWGVEADVRSIVGELGRLAGVAVTDELIGTWRQAEHELQMLVAGASPEHLASTWTNGATRSLDLRRDQQGERAVAQLPRLAELEDRVRLLTAERDDLRALALGYQQQIEELEAAQTSLPGPRRLLDAWRR